MEGVRLSEKSQYISEKSEEEDCLKQKWAKHEDGGFRWKNQGATKLSRRETTQVGEANGRRVFHVPSRPTHAPASDGCRVERNSCVRARGLPYARFFSPVGRSSHDDSKGGVADRKQCL